MLYHFIWYFIHYLVNKLLINVSEGKELKSFNVSDGVRTKQF